MTKDKKKWNVVEWDTYKFTVILESDISVEKGEVPTEENVRTYIKEDIANLIIDAEIYEVKKI